MATKKPTYTLTQAHVNILRHTLGNESCYRNYFCADKDHTDLSLVQDLCLMHFMEQHPGNKEIFYVTEVGKRVAWATFDIENKLRSEIAESQKKLNEVQRALTCVHD